MGIQPKRNQRPAPSQGAELPASPISELQIQVPANDKWNVTLLEGQVKVIDCGDEPLVTDEIAANLQRKKAIAEAAMQRAMDSRKPQPVEEHPFQDEVALSAQEEAAQEISREMAAFIADATACSLRNAEEAMMRLKTLMLHAACFQGEYGLGDTRRTVMSAKPLPF